MAKQVTLTLTLPNGKRKYIRGATRKEAEQKRAELQKQINSGLEVCNNPTVAEFAKVWLEEYKKGIVRDSTYINLRSLLGSHIVPELGRLKVKDVKPAHIRLMVSAMSGMAKSTQLRVLTVTRELFKAAMENDLILKNPCVSGIRPRGEDSEEKTPLTPEQEKLLIEKAKGTNMYLFVLLGLSAGLRHGELLGLRWSDFDFEKGLLTAQRSVTKTLEEGQDFVVSEDMKTASAHRTIPLPWSVIAEVRTAMLRSNSVYVIPSQSGSYLSVSSSGIRWRKLMKGLPFYATPHRMRHTRITRWFEQGLDLKEIQYLAGHANSKITLDIYTHYQKESRIQETAKKIQGFG